MSPKKIFYLPGLISLIGLPILLLLFGPEDPIQYTSLRLKLPSNEIDTTREMFTETYFYNKIKNCKVIEVDLLDKPEYYLNENRNTFVNNEKLKFIQNEMKRLQFTHDTTSVLKVSLDEDYNYGEFVWLINQALIYDYDYKSYTFINNDLYFFANPPPIVYSNIKLDPLVIDPASLIIPGYEPPSKWEIFKRNFQYQFDNIIFTLRYNWLLSIGFLLLIFIPSIIQILIKRNRLYH